MFSLRAIDTVLSAIDAPRAAMLEALAALVALPTENPPATQYLPCVELIAALLARLDVPHERIDIPSPADAPRAAVRAWIGERGPTLHFHGHYDVVPAMTHSAGRVLGHRGSDSSIPIRFSRWSTVFLFLATRSARIRRPVNSPSGTVKVAALFGPCVWLVMSIGVIPVLMRRPRPSHFAGGFNWWATFRS